MKRAALTIALCMLLFFPVLGMSQEINFTEDEVEEVTEDSGLSVERGALTTLEGLREAGDQPGFSRQGAPTTIGAFIARAIQVLLSISGIVFLLMLLWGGVRYMTAAGNETVIKTAKSTLTAALIGLVITASAYTISVFVLNQIGNVVG